MRILFQLFFCLSIFTSFSQEVETEKPTTVVDSLYREDQFYAGMHFNMMFAKPQNYSVTKISTGFSAGFLRDLPINKSRTIGFAAGLGASYDKFVHNLVVLQENNEIVYSIIPTSDYEKNKLETITVDLPLEFRWRNSTTETHRFFRVYSGVKLSYMLFSKSRFSNTSEKIVVKNNSDLNQIKTSVYLAFGYNTWNFYASYGVTPLFKSSAKIGANEVALQPLNLGLMFYIL